MDLYDGLPYWTLKHGIISSYPSLAENIHTEIVIMGSGITGALLAWTLTEAGHEVVVVDRRHTAMGSTAASTALIQYELDTPLYKLVKMKGEQAAIRVYQYCEAAVKELKNICKAAGASELYSARPSLQYASFKSHVPNLKKEYEWRQKAGIETEWLNEKTVQQYFGLDKPAGLLSATGASLDAYALAHQLLKKSTKKGLRIFDQTKVIEIENRPRSVVLQVENGKKITAKKLLIACGYESQNYLPQKVQQMQSTYAMVSEPIATKELWYRDALIWETATPYLYMRRTADGRIMMGGKDDDKLDPEERKKALPGKVKQLKKSFSALFPKIPFRTDFAWAGAFAGTKDGLPYIGAVNNRPRTFFTLGFGGNGIAFSVVAAKLAAAWAKGKMATHTDLFSFNR